MEIERKFIPKNLPENLNQYSFHRIEQAYLNTAPVLRIRKQDNTYILTYKGGGMMAREEYNLALNRKSYAHLLEKADGNVLTKTRYLIPIDDGLTAELDIFDIVDSSIEGIMLCSDGVTSLLADDQIERILLDEELTIEEKVHKIITKCNARGGNDNISVAYLDMERGKK